MVMNQVSEGFHGSLDLWDKVKTVPCRFDIMLGKCQHIHPAVQYHFLRGPSTGSLRQQPTTSTQAVLRPKRSKLNPLWDAQATILSRESRAAMEHCLQRPAFESDKCCVCGPEKPTAAGPSQGVDLGWVLFSVHFQCHTRCFWIE